MLTPEIAAERRNFHVKYSEFKNMPFHNIFFKFKFKERGTCETLSIDSSDQ